MCELHYTIGWRQTLQPPAQMKQPGQMEHMYELNVTHGRELFYVGHVLQQFL